MTDTQTTARRSYYVAAEASLRTAEDYAERARKLHSSGTGNLPGVEALKGLADTYTALSRQALALARFESEHPEGALGI